MIANYYAEIKIAIFQSISEANVTNEDRRQTQANIARFNSINSESIGWKFTKFVNDVAWLLPLNLLKADLQSANLLSNARAKSKDRSAGTSANISQI